MQLPKVTKPLFNLLVPSQNKEIKARPYVVKEEKILLMAQQSGQEKDIILAIKQVINNCIAEEFNINSLTTFDLEYMFLKLRSISVSNLIEVTYRDTEDGKTYDFQIDLDNVDMFKASSASNKIMVNDEVGIIMKWPSITVLENAPEDVSPTELIEYLIINCIDKIFDADSVYPSEEYTPEQLKEFLESLDVDTFEKIKTFFDDMPKMYYKIEYENSEGHNREIELTTLSDFFTWG